jgi:hypothetical protein
LDGSRKTEITGSKRLLISLLAVRFMKARILACFHQCEWFLREFFTRIDDWHLTTFPSSYLLAPHCTTGAAVVVLFCRWRGLMRCCYRLSSASIALTHDPASTNQTAYRG